MKAVGIQKAARRLAQAEACLANLVDLENGLNVHAFEDMWFEFLVNLHSVPEIIRTSSASNSRARQWINERYKDEIRKDPLLRFLFQARGTDFHGLDSGTQPQADGAKYLGYTPNAPMAFTMQANDGSIQTISGGAIRLEGDVTSFSFSFCLAPVTDNHGNTFDPPDEHSGQPIPTVAPVAIGKLAIEYYRRLLDEASKFSP